MNMNRQILGVVASGVLALGSWETAAVAFDIGVMPSGGLHFLGNGTLSAGVGSNYKDGQFKFYGADATAPVFRINGVTEGGVGDAVGYVGRIENTFTMGTIVTESSIKQSATVSGVGLLSIYDPDNPLDKLTATVEWIDIVSFKTGASVNTDAVLNLSNIQYSGSSQDLLGLLSSVDAYQIMNFSLPKIGTKFRDLNYLSANSYKTSFDADIIFTPLSVPDGGATLILLGAGFAMFAFARRDSR
jgi:hypothetical protein